MGHPCPAQHPQRRTVHYFFQPRRHVYVEVHLKNLSGPRIFQNDYSSRATGAAGLIMLDLVLASHDIEERRTASGESAIPKVHLGYSGFLEQLGSSDSREGMMLQ